MNSIISLIEFETLAALLVAVGAFSPGFLIVLFRSRFITGRLESFSEAGLKYVVASAIYYSASAPLFLYLEVYEWYSLSLLFFIIPILIGVAMGSLHQFGVLAWLSRRMRLSPSHPAPTSWDYVFGSLRSESWIIVTLKNHEQVFGFFGDRSFASSELGNRDIYIQDLRDPYWKPLEDDGRTRGLWISEEEIVMVQLITNEVSA
jgi:hypothetical protein